MMPETRPSLNDPLRELNNQLTDSGQSVLAYRLVATFYLINVLINLATLILLSDYSSMPLVALLISLVIPVILIIGLYRNSTRIKRGAEAFIIYIAIMTLYFIYKGVYAPVLFGITQFCFLASVYIPLKGKSTVRKLQVSVVFFVVFLILKVAYAL